MIIEKRKYENSWFWIGFEFYRWKFIAETRDSSYGDDARGIFAVITDHGLETVTRIQTAYEAKIQEILKDATQQFPHLEGPSLSSAFQKVGRLIA